MIKDAVFNQRLVGEFLRRARQDQGYSLRDLAAVSGVSASQLLRIESGEFDIRLSTLLRAAASLGVPAGMVLEQGLQVSPGFYAKRLGERGLEALNHIGKFSDAAKNARRRFVPFFAQCCVAVAYLGRATNPRKLVRVLAFPFKQMVPPFEDLADLIDSFGFEDRVALLRELQESPIDLLIRTRILSVEIIELYVTAAAAREHPFSGVPDFFRLL